MKKRIILLSLIFVSCTNINAQNTLEQTLYDAELIVKYSPNEYRKLQRKLQILKRDTSVQGVINCLSTLCQVEPQRVTSDKAQTYYMVEMQTEFARLCAQDSFVLPSILNYYNKRANIRDLFYSTNSYHYWTLEELKELCISEKSVYLALSSIENLYKTIEERDAIITANMNHYCFIERKLFGNPTYMIEHVNRRLLDSVIVHIEQITQIQDINNNVNIIFQKLNKILTNANNYEDAYRIIPYAHDILVFIHCYGSYNEIVEHTRSLINCFNLVYDSEAIEYVREIYSKMANTLYNNNFIAQYISSSIRNYASYSNLYTQLQQFILLEDSLRNLGYDFVDVNHIWYDEKYRDSDVFLSYRQQKTFCEYLKLREAYDLTFSVDGSLSNPSLEEIKEAYKFFFKSAPDYMSPLSIINEYVNYLCIDIISTFPQNNSPWFLDAMDLLVDIYGKLISSNSFYLYHFSSLLQLALTTPYPDIRLRICKDIIVPALQHIDFSKYNLYKADLMKAYTYALVIMGDNERNPKKNPIYHTEADKLYKLSKNYGLYFYLYDGMWIRSYLHHLYSFIDEKDMAIQILQNDIKKIPYLYKEDRQYMYNVLMTKLSSLFGDIGQYNQMVASLEQIKDTSYLEDYIELQIFAYAYLGKEAKLKEKLDKYIKYIQHNVQVDLFNNSGEKSSYMDVVLKYSKTLYNSYDIAASYPCKQRLAAACFDITLMTKSILLSVSHQIEEQLAHHPSDIVRQQYAYLQKLINTPTSDMGEFEKAMLQIDINNTNRALYSHIREWYDTHEPTFTIYNWRDVRNHLGKDSVAIEFVKYTSLDDSTTHYCALALRHDMNAPKCIYLGIDSVLTKEYFIWSPIIDSLHILPREHIFFAADGKYYQVPIEYLPTNENQTMADVYDMHRVSSTRQLCITALNESHQSADLFGGIQYGLTQDEMIKQSAQVERKRSWVDGDVNTLLGDSTRGALISLPGTLKEVQAIAPLFVQSFPHTGRQASEEAFKALDGQCHDVLHIGTHGFYLSESDAERRAGKNVGFLNIGSSQSPIDYSMSRTGLLLAGSQLAWEGHDFPRECEDGILTAKEIAQMDLHNVQLVVLSACETGLGDITGDGVAGLQRGFKKAGVQTIIMSLWKVDDNATQLLMKEFYYHWTNGKTKHEALRLAQNAVRYAVDEDGDRMFEDPVYWAGFIMLD